MGASDGCSSVDVLPRLDRAVMRKIHGRRTTEHQKNNDAQHRTGEKNRRGPLFVGRGQFVSHDQLIGTMEVVRAKGPGQLKPSNDDRGSTERHAFIRHGTFAMLSSR